MRCNQAKNTVTNMVIPDDFGKYYDLGLYAQTFDAAGEDKNVRSYLRRYYLKSER